MEHEFLGDFRIVKQIGKGSLGAVYLGEHRFIRKTFALKILPKELTVDESFVARFEEHVGVLATLDHLNLVKVHNISEHEGTYFLVTDYISDRYGSGQNLSTYLTQKSERLSEKEVMSILRQVAYALDYLHTKSFLGKGLMHGSLKLNNILVGEHESVGTHVYLSDMGLSRIVGEGVILSRMYESVAKALEVMPKLTGLESEALYANIDSDPKKLNKLHRSFLQSYAFLAPEQKLGGSLEHIGVKTDVYAFGVLAYFLLMGYLPEGHFAMPSQSNANYANDWDLLIRSTLSQEPGKRADNLIALLDQIATRKELKDVEPAIHKVAEQVKPVYKEVSPAKEEETPPSPPNIPKLASGHSDLEAQLTGDTRPTNRVKPMKRSSEDLEENSLVATLDKQPVLNPSELKKVQYEDDPGAIFKKQNIVAPYKPSVSEAVNVEPIMCEMVMIEGGEYYRGSNIGARDERSRHKVLINPFAIDVHPVTNEQFIRFLEVMGGEKEGNNNDIIQLKESRIKRVGGKLIIESGYAKHPVVGVSWYGAVAYAKWVGKRLPTEAEWEIAASGGLEENMYPSGDDIERSGANYFSSDTTPVMSYPPNKAGLYDMAGNVYDWCEDWYDYNFYETSEQEPDNPKGPPQGVYRVLRGGCWKSLKDDLRCSHRHRNNPGTMTRTYGFRLATDVA